MQPDQKHIDFHQIKHLTNARPVNSYRQRKKKGRKRGSVPGFGTELVMDCGTLSFMSSTHSLGKKPTWTEQGKEAGRWGHSKYNQI